MAVLIRHLRLWMSLVHPTVAPGQQMVALPGRPPGLDLLHLVAPRGPQVRQGLLGPGLRKSPKLPTSR